VLFLYTEKYPYSPRTQLLADMFPSWTKIKNDPESEGQKFLNTPALILDKLEEYLIYVSNNLHIQTADLDRIDRCFKADLPPKLTHNWNVKVYADNRLITVVDTASMFYTSEDDIAFIDWNTHEIFFRYFHGNVKVSGTYADETLPLTTLRPIPQSVWNEFDEFGLLFDTPRLPLETNSDYKDRILYTFKYPANSLKLGIIHGIARHLGLIKKTFWEDVSKPLALPEHVIIETIRVNGFTYPHIIKKDSSIVLEPMIDLEEEPEAPIPVSYIDDIELYALHEHPTNDRLYHLLFNEDGTAQPRLKTMAEYINQQAPMLWGYFKYNEAYWDAVEPENSGIHYVPNIFDANYMAWKNYKPERSSNHGRY